MSTQTSIRIIVTLTFLALLSACGASTAKDDNVDLGSSGTLSTDKPIAKCNKAGTATLSFKVAAQISGTTFDPNWANVFLSNLPTGFEAETSFIQFFKGQALNDANIGYATATVPFAIYDKVSFTYLNAGALYNSLKWSEVKNLVVGASPATFMSRVIFVLSLQDPTSTYQVLTAGSYNTADNTAIEAVPALLPTFYAKPADYAIKANGLARETVLQNLHPLKNQVGDYATLATALCQ